MISNNQGDNMIQIAILNKIIILEIDNNNRFK